MKKGLLQDERENYVFGGIASAISKAVSKKLPKSKIKKSKSNQTAFTEEQAEMLRQVSEDATKLKQRGFSDDRIEELIKEAYELGEPSNLIIALKKPIVREQKAEGGPMDDQMMMVMAAKPMESDIDMEDNYTKFIMEEALTEDEEDMLVSKLEQDNELQMLFDKVIDVAQEFAGSGPVDGPGSGVSDSIPARLSDGEFVFTAKATEEIGADELMRMMKDAEAQADERQQVAVGGMLDSGEEEVEANVNRQQVTNEGTFIPEEDTTVRDKVRETMMDPSAQSRYVRS